MSATLQIPVEISFTVSADLVGSTFHTLQRDIRRESRRALLHALQTAVAEMEKALLASPLRCTQCQHPMRSRGRTVRRVVTVFGPVALSRRKYRCGACGAVRRPLDEWLGLVAGTEYTAAVREQALYLAADLSYERAADVLRHVGGIGMSGRQIQHLLREESCHIEAALGTPGDDLEPALRRRFRRAGKDGAQRIVQLRQLKTSGLWEAYWARRFAAERSTPAASR